MTASFGIITASKNVQCTIRDQPMISSSAFLQHLKMDKSRLSLPLAEWAALNGHYHLQNVSSNGLFGGSSSSNGSNSNGSHSDDPPSVPEGEVAATPCTPGDPMTHYHHKNDDHFCAAFARMNRMRINSQVRPQSSLLQFHSYLYVTSPFHQFSTKSSSTFLYESGLVPLS